MVDTPEQRALRTRFETVVTDWNAALYAVLIGAKEALSRSVRELDRQVDMLAGRALDQGWTREAFREERRPIGESMARHVDVARKRAGLPALGLSSIWTWADEHL